MAGLTAPSYLAPYLKAARRFGGGFGSLLWASPRTQGLRFEALGQIADFSGKSVADIGCGRGDLLDYLLSISAVPSQYIGLEAVEAVARAAEDKRRLGFTNCTILRADFIRQPQRLFVGAEFIVFSGSLNTLEPAEFYATLGHAFQAAGEKLIFNFLDLPNLAGESYLHWYPRREVLDFAHRLTPEVQVLDGYLTGDCTMALTRPAS